MKASEGCQGRGTEGKEGIEQYVSLEGGWIAQKWVPFPQLYWADTWLQTKEKKKTLVPILLIPPHTHTHTKIGKLNQNVSLGLKLAKDYLGHVIRSFGSDGFQHQISAHDVRTQKSQLHPLNGSCQRTHELESDAGS